MNDRYLFKAKTCNGEWVTGLLAHKDNKYYISNRACMPFAFLVRPDTICQCTGLEDKHGNLIWENDICIYDDRAKFVVKFGEYNEFIDKSHIGFYAKWENRWDGYYRKDLGYWSDLIEVIGSCVDNPELLEVER